MRSRGSDEKHESSKGPPEGFKWPFNFMEFSGERPAPVARFLWAKKKRELKKPLNHARSERMPGRDHDQASFAAGL